MIMENNHPPESKFGQGAQARIDELQLQIGLLNKEIHTINGKISNRDEDFVANLQKENTKLKLRLVDLEKALRALLADAYKGRQSDELRLKLEILRQSAIGYFKKNNVDPEIWKNIES